MTNKEGLNINPYIFLEYPVLLKAVLNSTKITKEMFSTRPSAFVSCLLEDILDFSLDDVTLPDNYMETTIISAAPLPRNVKDALEKRYKECVEQKALK